MKSFPSWKKRYAAFLRNREWKSYICLNMEKRLYHVFYLGMDKGKAYEHPVPILRLKRKLPIPGGAVQISFAYLPEYGGKSFWKKNAKPWKEERLFRQMQALIQQAVQEYQCWDVVFAQDWKMNGSDLPFCLLAACLYQKRPFDTVYISFGQEDGMYEMEQMTELLIPYLPRLKQVFFVGRGHRLAESMADFLYEEYGMVMFYAEQVPRDGICITRAETWKFLDATVKNGYNTLVN